ncbi:MULTISPECIES: hypothetical protein [Halobacillus]|uniref:hypothetical protein n=1 Tax=Halobacillus TaxID=45667 RepID=UPI001EF0DC0F|nr:MULTISPECIES: hypothetical protein [Halobacillus]
MMWTDQEQAVHLFEQLLNESAEIAGAEFKSFTGLPFVYVYPSGNTAREGIEDRLKWCAAKAMKGKRLSLAMNYVRRTQTFYVYRVRFLVPQRKMFCCGNFCDDCIRFTNP